jgi:WD repeat-containing protein 19
VAVQEDGNYKVAHSKLFSTYKQLEELNAPPTTELVRALMLIHSYILVKSLISINDHTNAARMLMRVARNISKFPRHMVPILTSTVIECQRAGFKKTAFEYASMLMRPEYR